MTLVDEVVSMLTARELVKELKVSVAAIRKWTRDPTFPCYRIGRLVRYEPDSVKTWLNTHGQHSLVVRQRAVKGWRRCNFPRASAEKHIAGTVAFVLIVIARYLSWLG